MVERHDEQRDELASLLENEGRKMLDRVMMGPGPDPTQRVWTSVWKETGDMVASAVIGFPY